MKATLTFKNIETAKDFSVKWGRETLTGYDMSAVKKDGLVEVTVYGIDDHKKQFIDNYISNAQ